MKNELFVTAGEVKVTAQQCRVLEVCSLGIAFLKIAKITDIAFLLAKLTKVLFRYFRRK